MLQINSVEIGHTTALLHIPSLQLEQGKLYGLIGRNGIGKSTFLQTLVGLIPLLSGEIFVQGNSLETLRKKELAKKIALVRTSFPIIENLTVYAYLLLGRVPYTNVFGTTNEQDAALVRSVIDLLQITHLQAKFTSQLSDGEKQLITIAQVLVQQTGVVLLDEPTAFLDYENKWKILKILKDCTIKNQLCTVFSSHDLDITLEVADYLLMINPQTKEIREVKTDKTSKADIISFCFPSL
jgi:iron complex transport system ATP-binding protein